MSCSRRAFGLGAAALAMAASSASLAADSGWPNVFISPAGQPFRAKTGAPYPVAVWFKQADKNGDGKLDKGEYLADAEAFFKVLDANGDGVIDSREVEIYEHIIAPEVLGYTVPVARQDLGRARLWLAQDSSSDSDSGSGGDGGAPSPPADQPPSGAGPYNFFEAPEPITAADVDFDGIIRKADFMALAERRFRVLDPDDAGYLLLARLPKTYAQKKLEKHGPWL